MARQTDRESLQSAWRALTGNGMREGWRTIPLALETSCGILAGRHFPGNEEAILVGFNSVRMPIESSLPQGRGFRVENVKHEIPGGAKVWVSLARQPTGNLDMFTRMAEDVIDLLKVNDQADDEMLLRLFLGRVRAWQEFMDRRREGVLGPEAEIGLIGELLVLKMILQANVAPVLAVNSWYGPLEGLQDFLIGAGAIEVKSTTAASGFPVTIASLEQLDNSLVHPLFLVGIRLSFDSSGRTLPEFIAEVGSLLDVDLVAQEIFKSLALRAGFLWSFSDSYKRRYFHASTLAVQVDADFPCLTHSNVHRAIKKARYDLDLDIVNASDVGLNRALEELGVIRNWNL